MIAPAMKEMVDLEIVNERRLHSNREESKSVADQQLRRRRKKGTGLA